MEAQENEWFNPYTYTYVRSPAILHAGNYVTALRLSECQRRRYIKSGNLTHKPTATAVPITP